MNVIVANGVDWAFDNLSLLSLCVANNQIVVL
jgi:hypothetical protein